MAWPELFAMARAGEAIGLDSLWLGDHLLYDLPGGTTRGPWEVWTSLAALAAVTERVELGPLVAATSFHAPAMLAKQAATVDAISGGRLILGLGAGWNEREYRAFGFPYDKRVSRFAEAFTIIRTLLSEGQIDFHGEFYDLENCVLDPGPVRPGGVPLMLGSTGPRMLGIGLGHITSWNAWWNRYGNTPEGFAALKEQVDAHGHLVEATAAVLVAFPGGQGRVMGESSYKSAVPPVQGTAEEIAQHLAAMAAAGATHLQLVLDPITQESIEQLAEVLAILDR
ncbi:hypothetical protein Kisp01_38420 [Kineosporia sp. NBRC 101677]|nr:hypothetical protein Kisp01_38420 [Kineosporia sp. NBRC 101677]